MPDPPIVRKDDDIPVLEYVPRTCARSPKPKYLATASFYGGLVSLAALALIFSTSGLGSDAAATVGPVCFVLSILATTLGIAGRRHARRSGLLDDARRATAGIVLGLGCALATGLVPMAILARSSERANRVKCAANLRQIGSACLLYAQDTGQLPASFNQLVMDCGETLFICPSSSDTKATGASLNDIAADFGNPGHCSYVYTGAGLKLPLDPTAILAYEPSIHHDREGSNILYADGLVKWIGRKEAEYIISEIKAGHNPPRARK